jgi:polysaccharide biosynthesis/export protein
MKAVKYVTVILAVIFFNGLLINHLFAQDKEKNTPTENKTTAGNAIATEEIIDDNLPNNKRRNEKYRIGYQDTLEILVAKHTELSQTVSVNSDGTIMLPRLDRPIIAVCKTERELAEVITALYKTYLKNPYVNVRAIDQRSQPFAVIGAVEKPGSFYLNRKIRLLELLAFAGGPDIQVARVGNVSGCVEANDLDEQEVIFLSYKIREVMDGKENPWMQPGDIVSVLDAEQAFVVGNVKEPSKVPLKEPITLTQAIAYAGGLAPEAKTSKIRIQRQQSGSSIKTEMIFDLKDIASKKIPDPVLQANDIVEVPKDGVKSARNGIIKALTNGIPGLFYGL